MLAEGRSHGNRKPHYKSLWHPGYQFAFRGCKLPVTTAFEYFCVESLNKPLFPYPNLSTIYKYDKVMGVLISVKDTAKPYVQFSGLK